MHLTTRHWQNSLEKIFKKDHFYNTNLKKATIESAFYEGQRSLVVFIESLLNQKE